MQYNDAYKLWCDKATDSQVLEQLANLDKDDKAKKNAFYKNLEFGTAGLRGIMGAGTNCLNIYTIMRATQGVVNYMHQNNLTTACITHDSRLNSDTFAQTVASVFGTNGIKCYFTQACQPTPFLSYMTRELGCDIGINITASHNPSQYNGYKVYDNKGCQITEKMANEIIKQISVIDPFEVKSDSFSSLVDSGMIELVSDNLVEKYIQTVIKQGLNDAQGISVAYTPLNGTGYKIIPDLLGRIGVGKVDIVAEQSMPDGRFTTCPYPNPEKTEALKLALDVAQINNSDIVIGTDPDCDRIGVAVRHNDSYQCLSGNEVGVLITDYVLAQLKLQNKLPQKPTVVKTIVTTPMVDKVCKYYGATVIDVLTGFKYIGNVIANMEQKGEQDNFVFGFEESCGYLRGTYVRDKDGAVATMLVAEMTAVYKRQGKTLIDRLEELHSMFGRYENKTVSYQFDGADGAQIKSALLQQIHNEGFEQLGGSKVIDVCDYLTQTKYDLPKSDVMRFRMANGSQLLIRPSGTEPLIKNYITVCGTEQTNKTTIDAILKQLDQLYNAR